MSLSVVFKDPTSQDGPFSLASANGWEQFTRWVESLPQGEYPSLLRFTAVGKVASSDLSTNLRTALHQYPPGNPSVASTARGLLKNMGVGALNETAEVVGDHEELPNPATLGPVTNVDGARRFLQLMVRNSFCPTGPGGGINPTCSPGGAAGGHHLPSVYAGYTVDKVKRNGDMILRSKESGLTIKATKSDLDLYHKMDAAKGVKPVPAAPSTTSPAPTPQKAKPTPAPTPQKVAPHQAASTHQEFISNDKELVREVRRYTGGGNHYIKLNEKLRKSPSLMVNLADPRSYAPGSTARTAGMLQKAIQEAPPLPEGTTVYRGVSGGVKKLLGSLKEGVTVRLDGMQSTSTDRTVAEDFGATAIFHISKPKGLSLGQYSYAGQSEVLLPHGAIYRVSKVEGKRIHVEQLDSGMRVGHA